MVSYAQQPSDHEPLDLLIIGAGIYGIQAARSYLTIHPTHKILVLEADNSPGGVWSKERVYPHFITQSPLNIWEFSDTPLILDEDEKQHVFHEYFPAKAFARYLEQYVDEHVFEGESLRDRIICNARVDTLSQIDKTWRVMTSTGQTYTARRVLDAVGLTSLPNIPQITGSKSFQGLHMHSKDFGRHSSTILQPNNCVVIIGGGKSAADVAYACAKSGLQDIHWVVRKSGKGPAAYLPADAPIRKYGNSNAAFHTSLMASIIACIYAPETLWSWFLYRTYIGRMMHTLIWTGLQGDVLGRAKYNRPDEKAQANGFKNLKPDGDLFWQFANSGVNQRPDFFDTIAAKVKVYRQDIDHISSNSLTLADGMTIDANTIIYATGWSVSSPYLDPQTAYSLGLATNHTPPDDTYWTALEREADKIVLQRFPCLANPPSPPTASVRQGTPFRLYRSIFPPNTSTEPPTIAFLGRTDLANHTYNAEIQALYAIAAFDGHVTLPRQELRDREVALVNAWMKRRYPTKGMWGYFFFFDVVPYTDALLGDLGMGYVSVDRGLMGAMAARDLRGLLAEYVRRVRGEEGKKGV